MHHGERHHIYFCYFFNIKDVNIFVQYQIDFAFTVFSQNNAL